MIRHFFLMVLLGIAACVAVWGFLSYVHARQLSALAEAVSRAYVPESLSRALVADASSDDVRDTLRLAWYYVATARAPILPLAGSAPSHLRSATTRVQAAEGQYFAILPEEDRTALSGVMSPSSFLRLIAPLEEARLSFLTEATLESAMGYHAALLSALSAYEKDAQILLGALRGAGGIQFTFVGGKSDASAYAEAVEALAAEVRHGLREEAERFDCLVGTSNCTELPPEPFAEEMEADAPHAPSADAQTVSSFLLASGRYDRQFYTRSARVPGSEDTVFLSGARCNGGRPSHFLSFLLRDPETGLLSRKSLLSDDLYLLDTQAASSSATGYGRYLKELNEQGLRWYSQPVNLYTCPDSGFDAARASSVIALRNLAKDEPLAPSIPGIEEEEKALAEAPLVSDALASGYAAVLSRALQREGLAPEEVRDVRERIHIWKGQTGGLAEVLMDAAILNEALAYYAQFTISSDVLLLTRSYPSLFFLPFNGGLVRQSSSFFSSVAPLSSSPPIFRTYFADLIGEVSLQELMEQSRLQDRISEDSPLP